MLNQSAQLHDACATQAGGPEAIFVSDVHLKQSDAATLQAFNAFLHDHAAYAKRLFLLGDLFEYWAGDDDLGTPLNRQTADALRQLTEAGTEVYWIAGNRDFLVGSAFAQESGAILLPDPSVITIGEQRIVACHGDAQCIDDIAYMAFRRQVRDPVWQQQFLAQPLAVRKKVIEQMRIGSREAQRSKTTEIMDVNASAIDALFDVTGTSIMIHGHTHRPARHEWHDPQQKKRIRYVLPDWDCETEPRRGGWIAMHADGTICRFAVDGMVLD